MSEPAVPIEEMTHDEALATLRHCRRQALLAQTRYHAVLDRLSHLWQVEFILDFAQRGLPQPCPHFDRPVGGLNPDVRLSLRLAWPRAGWA